MKGADMQALLPLPTPFPGEAQVWGAEAGGGSRLPKAAKCFCSKWGEKASKNRSVSRASSRASSQHCPMRHEPAGENVAAPRPPKLARTGPDEGKLEAGGRKDRNVRNCLSKWCLDMWKLLEALWVGVLAMGALPVRLAEGWGHGPGTEGTGVAHGQPGLGWGGVGGVGGCQQVSPIAGSTGGQWGCPRVVPVSSSKSSR